MIHVRRTLALATSEAARRHGDSEPRQDDVLVEWFSQTSTS